MSFTMLLIWGLVTALVVWLVRDSRNPHGRPTGEPSQAGRADEVLAERFASGEIDEAEFTRGRTLLHAPGAGS